MDKEEKRAQPSSEEDISQKSIKPRTRGKKRKRNSDIEDILPENAFEVEQNVQACAMKNNLDEASVKKILKKVVTNDHVLALVHIREKEEASETENRAQPKLTRAKAKELGKISPKSAPWNIQLTPIKHIPVKTRPEVKALIAQELHEDEEDEEYEPTHDDVPSDDDQTLESCSDLDSQPRTPATPRSPGYRLTSPQVVTDGPFKVPQILTTPVRRKIDLDEATIALRTRSKLSLSATPIEHIESSFVPPDDIPTPDIDDPVWNEFLNECLDPTATSRVEDDDEADPEYNVAADPDAHDEEDALESTVLKISKKELNDLVNELFNVMPDGDGTEDALAENLAIDVLGQGVANKKDLPPTHWDGKQETLSDEENTPSSRRISFEKSDTLIRFSIGKTETNTQPLEVVNHTDKEIQVTEVTESTEKSTQMPSINIQMEEVSTNVIPANHRLLRSNTKNLEEAPPLLRSWLSRTVDKEELRVEINETAILPEQIQVLQQQLRQHVQLAAGNFLQLYVNPALWSSAPIYKEYLEHFSKMVEGNPQSVANVCNLEPALDLMKTWEATVSVDNEDNKKMVEFIQKEAERCHRRALQNCLYVGNFPQLLLDVIANSTVFLYPYLVPAMPYRTYLVRKFSYRRSEDELIVLGLDQFWKYIENNTDIFKLNLSRAHPRHRKGLSTTLKLVAKYMFPWTTSKALLNHINKVKNVKDNPIAKFFSKGIVTTVKHNILPFNPKITLYEQPEHELPRIWVRHLAKNSSRFKDFIFKRKHSGKPPEGGIPVNLRAGVVEQLTKAALPIDFTKSIVCHNTNVHPKVLIEPAPDKIDLHIDKNKGTANIVVDKGPLQSTLMPDANVNQFTKPNYQSTAIIQPVLYVNPTTTIYNNANRPENPLVPTDPNKVKPDSTSGNQIGSNMFRVVETSTGAFLVPITVLQTNTANSATGGSVTILSNNLPEDSNVGNTQTELRNDVDSIHCKCCQLLRKISKKQTRITDFFKFKSAIDKECECEMMRFPKLSKKLKLLIYQYKTKSWCVYRNLHSRINKLDNAKSTGGRELETDFNEECSLDEIASVTNFNMKLVSRLNAARNNHMKKKVEPLLYKFDLDYGDPILLAEQLYTIFEVELVNMYKEFLAFLTPYQADRLGKFKDYFIQNCYEELMQQIDTEISDRERKTKLLSLLRSIFVDNVSTACEMCASILNNLNGYPSLARYVFNLFPHKSSKDEKRTLEKPKTKEQPQTKPTTVDVPNHIQEETRSVATGTDDDSMDMDITNATGCGSTLMETSGPDDSNMEVSVAEPETKETNQPEPNTLIVVVKNEEIESLEFTVSKTEIQDYDTTETSLMIDEEDDVSIKSEMACWNRDEDKVILQLLMEYLTPEARKDKTILQIIEEKNIIENLSECLEDKSVNEIKERVLYLLQVIVISDF